MTANSYKTFTSLVATPAWWRGKTKSEIGCIMLAELLLWRARLEMYARSSDDDKITIPTSPPWLTSRKRTQPTQLTLQFGDYGQIHRTATPPAR